MFSKEFRGINKEQMGYTNPVLTWIRVIWYFEDNVTIILADVGHHDILKQF